MQSISLFLKKRLSRARYWSERFHSEPEARAARRRIVFMHIPKCAGSSVNMLFKSQYGSGRSKHVVIINDFAKDYSERLRRAKDALFVGGHFGFETLEKIRGDAYVLTVLRDPFERLRSIYGHLRTRSSRASAWIGDMSLEDFVANEDARVLHHTDNVMARMLAASHDRRRVAGWDHALLAQAALQNLKTFDHVGFCDALDESLRLVADVAGIRFSHQFENATADKAEVRPPRDAIAPFVATLRPMALPRLRADLTVFNAARGCVLTMVTQKT